MNKKLLIVIIAILAVLGFFVFASKGSGSNNGTIQVQTNTIATGDVKSYLSVTGTIIAGDSRDYYYAGYKVDSINVKVGDSIKIGEKLVGLSQGDIKTDIKSDIDGTVASINAKKGENTNGSLPVVSVMDMETMQIKTYLSKYDAGSLSLANSSTITYNNKKYEGSVTSIDPIATSRTTQTGTANMLGATIDITSDVKGLIPGFDADVDILTGQATGVTVLPIECLMQDSNGSYVFLVQDGKSIRQNIKLGVQSSDSAEVKEGLSSGSVVIKNPPATVTNGTAVTVVNTN